jgi:hypothetical protein
MGERWVGGRLAWSVEPWGFRVPWSTLEVRWFLPGPLAESGSALEAWFRSRPRFGGSDEPAPIAWAPAPPAWRQDRYLLIPGQDDMGIKWREGRLEIKCREAALGHRAFAPAIEGMCERWVKWSYAGEAIERRFRGLFRAGAENGVATVEKRRLRRHLRLDPSGVVEVGLEDPRERGVDVELAQIRTAGSPGSPFGLHWSLAFEAFPGDQICQSFLQVVARFLEGCPALPLPAERSMSYPRWLLAFDQPARNSG